MKSVNQTVVVLGASNKPDRYSNMAVRMLLSHGYKVIPVHPRLKEIEGLPVASRLEDIHEDVHSLSIYLGPDRSLELTDSILLLKPGRVIFNPGTESNEIEKKLKTHGIPYKKACTLVMLRTGQF